MLGYLARAPAVAHTLKHGRVPMANIALGRTYNPVIKSYLLNSSLKILCYPVESLLKPLPELFGR
jgi:hypothetical protein